MLALGHLHAVVLTILGENALALHQVEGAAGEGPHGDGVLAEDGSYGLDHGVLSKSKF